MVMRRGPILSVLAHGVFLLVMVLLFHARTHLVVKVRTPGVASGQVIALTYSAAGAPVPVRRPPHPEKTARLTPKLRAETPAMPAQAADAAPAAGSPGLDALGTGDVNMALLQSFPTPHPDLTTLPHGTAGDVILDVVIDPQGRIAKVTLLKGLGGSVDTEVVATVQQWTFTPATQDGKAVASEQELLFHYERG